MDKERKLQLLGSLVAELCTERGEEVFAAQDADELWTAFRALVNTRPPWPASEDFLAMQDELLQGLIAEAGIHTVDEATPSPTDPRLLLWRGDITTLAVGAIVNAANSQMLGCWVPGHHCIDNAIHTYAGIQLRAECARIMTAQGYEEPTGQAKITGAYNLPTKRIIHTVGPIAGGRPTDLHRRQLASCYKSCLDLAMAEGLRSIAFCCISTGIFGFPQREAAEIAVRTVRAWLDNTRSDMVAVFNVFGEEDERIYRDLLFTDSQ
ncbi:MAG: protein-ADP-ribose hydrolase [Atopobiaceae bacterium]|nr:protein-ADP-ribose hydrolase [Atopobiaceae bacterium]